MSALNDRRHGLDLHIRDKDLLTGRDARRLIAEAMEEYKKQDEHRRAIRKSLVVAHNSLPWWKRAVRGLAFRAFPFTELWDGE